MSNASGADPSCATCAVTPPGFFERYRGFFLSPGTLITAANALRTDLLAAIAELKTGIVIPTALAIKAGSSAVVKSTAAFVARVDGTAVSKAADTDMSALVGVIATTKLD